MINLDFDQTQTLYKTIEISKSQYFYMSSTVKIDCNESIFITSKWTIHRCNRTIEYPQLLTNKSGELFIPPRTLEFGFYEIKLIVTINNRVDLSTEAKLYLNVIRSNVIVRLIPSEVSLVTHRYGQNLKLDPGSFSIDPDSDSFNANVTSFHNENQSFHLSVLQNWFYIYSCQISTTKNYLSSSVFNQTIEKKNQSYIVIPAEVLENNTVYDFIVELINRENSSVRATGYLSVHIQDSKSYMIAIG